jgi:hypothetical protein
MAKVTKSFRLSEKTLAMIEALRGKLSTDKDYTATDVVEICIRRVGQQLCVDLDKPAKKKGGTK